MSVFRLKGTAGPVTNETWKLDKQVIIGSDPESEIHVESEAIASRHAELTVGEDQIELKLIAQGGELFLNGIQVNQALLSSGDEIRIGGCRWMLQAPGLRPQKVLTEDAVRQRIRWLPWVVVATVAGLGLAAWWLGYLPF